MKVLQINVVVNKGSTGRISEQIGEMLINDGCQSYIAHHIPGLPSKSQTIKVGNKLDFYKHVLCTRLFDKHGFCSKRATKKLINEIENMNPDIIHLHNLHGYYIHVGELFNYLNSVKIPVVWTFHDCWSFTGHCAHFEDIGCEKWKRGCHTCPKIQSYPKSMIVDNSKKNYLRKKKLFASHVNLTIVTPSVWLKNCVAQSFLKNNRTYVINNGIDLSIFKPISSSTIRQKLNIEQEKIILGVASVWANHRGLLDLIELSKMLDSNFKIVLVGLSKKQIENLPSNIIGIQRTEDLNELVELYSMADIYVNPTYSDTFPTTNIEALACGTPVITYNTGGSPEAIDENTGLVVVKGNINGLLEGISIILKNKDRFVLKQCRDRAAESFNKNDRFKEYLNLYKELITRKER